MMHDTTISRNARLIGEINDKLAANCLKEIMSDEERLQLVAKRSRLNAEITPTNRDPAKESATLRSRWTYFVANHLDRPYSIVFYVALAVLTIVTVVTIISGIMIDIGSS